MPSPKLERFRLGVCYYPEHWPEDLWDDDFRRMRELGFSVIRVAEFAWSIFEPEEGVFSFELFDRAIDLAYDHGLKVILGTPTATPPAWLTHKYPEVLNGTQTGVPYQHAMRRHTNYSAPELSARIVRKLAEHYGQHPAVIGWQLDNELNCEVDVFYSAADQVAFMGWLEDKYSTLDELKRAWGTVFWNQTYSDWAQVKLTGPTPSASPNPHQALDEKRFFSASAISFACVQSNILRELAPKQWVTTNGLFGHLDSHRLTEEALDFISYDSYPNFSTIMSELRPDLDNPLKDRYWSWLLSTVRSISPNFCVMEQQSRPGGWTNRLAQPAPKPGQLRLWTYQSVAHGADMVLYFRWRTATMGTEIYWHGLNDYHNRPNRRVAEAAQVGRELNELGPRLVGTRTTAEVGIVSDYDNDWDGELDSWHGPYTQQSVSAWFTALQYKHIPVDAVYLQPGTGLENLTKYQVLIYPHPAILTDATAALLTEYVRQRWQARVRLPYGLQRCGGSVLHATVSWPCC